jgi:hypothetical protein
MEAESESFLLCFLCLQCDIQPQWESTWVPIYARTRLVTLALRQGRKTSIGDFKIALPSQLWHTAGTIWTSLALMSGDRHCSRYLTDRLHTLKSPENHRDATPVQVSTLHRSFLCPVAVSVQKFFYAGLGRTAATATATGIRS